MNIENASHVPAVTKAYEINRQSRQKAKTEDPLRKLIEKQQVEVKKGGGVIQKIQTNPFSYDIILFNDRIMNNIMNFCCTTKATYKSPLCFDFTFNLGESPPYFLLVSSYQNTSVVHKQNNLPPTMLGPVMICHKKDETSVNQLCNTMIDKCPGIRENIKVIGADGEKSIINACCNAFSSSYYAQNIY